MLVRPRRSLVSLLCAAAAALCVSCSGTNVPDGPPEVDGPATSQVLPSPAPGPTAGSPTPPSGQHIKSTFFGMHDGRVTRGTTPNAPVGALRFWDSGTSWRDVETSSGQFTWSGLDTAVRTAEDAGARPLLVLGQTPAFHATQPAQAAAYGPGAASMPEIGAWRRYVTAVAKRYGNRIDYQVWNEANVVGYWSGTPQQLARLTLVAARAIRQVTPKATIVAPAFPLRLSGQRRYFENFWSLQSPATDLAGAVDAVAVHLYPPADGLPEAEAGLLEDARKVLDEHGIDRPVWNTEINYGLMGGPEPPPIPNERQRAFLMRTYLLNAGLGVKRVYWYRWDIGQIANTRLTEEDLTTETLAGRSFAVIRDWLGGTLAQRCDRSDTERGLWRCTARKGNQERTFWWKPRGPASKLAVEDAHAWVRADGTLTRCRATCRVPVSETPVMVVSRR